MSSNGTKEDAAITPLNYTPPTSKPSPGSRSQGRWYAVAALLLVLALLTWFVLGARAVEVVTEPADARIDVSGGLAFVFGKRILLHPGSYTLEVSAAGHSTARREIRVNADAAQRLTIVLDRLPGRLALRTEPVAARLSVDGAPIGESNAAPLVLAAGEHVLRVEADRFIPWEQAMTITGMDELQSLDLRLAPGWGDYEVDSKPSGASILVDDVAVATTPARIELLAGTHHLRLSLDGHRDGVLMVEATAGETRTLEPVVLERADARLAITTRPAGASVTLDGIFQGRAPLELAIDSSLAHEIIAFKTGHDRVVRKLAAHAGSQELTLELPALSGKVELFIEPADADVLLDARPLPPGQRSLTLSGVGHTLKVRRSGYQSQEVHVMPRPGFTQRVEIKLVALGTGKPAAPAAAQDARITTTQGQELVLLRPRSFTMGSSRRELGRRANEGLHEVRMSRPFYLGIAEVGNAEFRRFRPTHRSGDFKGRTLDDDELPVVNVGWEDAALYCNWLSEREKMAPFYRVKNARVVGFDPASRGYRLPSEAEWAWAASVMADGSVSRFAWGAELPPPAGAGNYADRSGATLLGEIIGGYDDGFAVAAPRRRFKANRHGIFDLDGNAAEWVHDVYEPLLPANVSDPLGRQTGDLHVIRGASWRNGDITTLRLAFRDYGKEARADLGFRLARYAE